MPDVLQTVMLSEDCVIDSQTLLLWALACWGARLSEPALLPALTDKGQMKKHFNYYHWGDVRVTKISRTTQSPGYLQNFLAAEKQRNRCSLNLLVAHL